MTTRLIERFLPIAAIGEEGARERRLPTSLPPINFLHVWWARRPLVASRSAILASLAPATTDHAEFQKALGIAGDPVATRAAIEAAKRTGRDLGSDPYGYPRAFKYDPARDAAKIVPDIAEKVVLDATAGGGSIPFEALRLGTTSLANDLNPVAAIILKATTEYPYRFGKPLLERYKQLAEEFSGRVEAALQYLYPEEDEGCRVDGYIWTRTTECPYCGGETPLSPTWVIAPGRGIKVGPHLGAGPNTPGRVCTYDLVAASSATEPTVAGGDGVCVFEDCGRAISGTEIKTLAKSGKMGDQLVAVAYRRRVDKVTKNGSTRSAWERNYRAARDKDDNRQEVDGLLAAKLPEWEAFDIIPNESYPEISNDDRPLNYGMPLWRDQFSNRQLFAHGTSSEVFRAMVDEHDRAGTLDDLTKAAFVYIAFSLDKFRDYNSRMTRWHSKREVIVNTFDRHDFAFKWSYAEMAASHVGRGLEWALAGSKDSLSSIIDLISPDVSLFSDNTTGRIAISNSSGSSLPHIENGSVDAVIIDPPYGANVMYAELSDFFYVWLKRTAGLVVPELFTRRLADKEAEAVANAAHFKGQKGAAKLANRDYQDKMAGIFAECRRVLKDDGIMTVMFTHKDTGAWDALAMSLMDAGFVITASWPVNTEASGSLHIKDKAAANSTIFLVCRPRLEQGGEASYWEEVEPLVAKAVRERIDEFQASGIAGVDLYLASFGPALEAFSRHWPLTRGTPAPQPPAKRGSQGDLLEEFDPYAVRPEDALNAARREVKAWRLAQLADRRASRDMDPATAWVALAWDAFRAPQFAYDEGLRLARAVGLDMTQVVGRLAEKKGSDLKLWDSATRVAKGALGPANGSRGMIDALHHAANTARKQSVEAARDQLEANGLLNDDEFKVALEVMLEVLPPSKTFSGIDADDAVKPAADDFDALEKLRRIVYGEEIGAPKQLSLYEQLDVA